MAEKKKWIAVKGINYKQYRAEPGEPVDFLPAATATRLAKQGFLTEAGDDDGV